MALPLLLATVLAARLAVVVGGILVDPHVGDSDFAVYDRAARALATGHPLYAAPPPCCFDYAAMEGRYTYPPLLAILLRPLTLLSSAAAARVFTLVSVACLVAAITVMNRMVAGRVGPAARAWLLVVALSSQPVEAGLRGMQIENAVLLLVAVAALCVVRASRPRLGGAALAAGAALKLAPALLLPAMLWLPRRLALRGVAAALAAGAALLLVMLLASGETVEYFRTVLPSFSSGVVAPWNRSAPGVVLRVVAATGHTPPPALRVVFPALQLGLVALTLVAVRRAAGEAGRACALAALLAVIPITQGVTWDHHLVTAVLVVVLLAPSLRAWSFDWVLCAAGVLLTDVNQHALEPAATAAGLDHPAGAGVVLLIVMASINLSGMLCLYVAALRCARATRIGRHASVRDAAPASALGATLSGDAFAVPFAGCR